MTTISDALRAAKNRLASVSDSASLDAAILLAHVLKVERHYLYMEPKQPLTDEQSAQYDALIDRAADGEPIAYILGRKAWYDMELIVSPAVLIPRWETEQLLELAIQFCNLTPQPPLHMERERLRAVDVGTGSGALAVGLKKHCPQVEAHAVDISADALEIARANAAKYNADVMFHQGDLLSPLFSPPLHMERGLGDEVKVTFDLIMANLPYIASDTIPSLAVSKYEPHLALDGGADGLILIRRLLDQIVTGDFIRAGGCILLEIGADQGESASELARKTFPHAAVELIRDLAGRDRIVQIHFRV